jgi:hypothetical protein
MGVVGLVQCRGDQKFRLAVGSFLEEYNNKVQIITVRALL